MSTEDKPKRKQAPRGAAGKPRKVGSDEHMQAKEELFARRVMEGRQQADAYREIYPTALKWTPQIVAQKASTFARRPNVQARLAELRAKSLAATEVTAERVIAELARLAFFDIRKVTDKDGNPLPIQELDDETAKAVVGLDIVQFGNADAGRGAIMKVKMADKLGALTTLARHHGLLNDKLKIGEDPDNPLTGLMTFLQAGAGRIKPGAK